MIRRPPLVESRAMIAETFVENRTLYFDRLFVLLRAPPEPWPGAFSGYKGPPEKEHIAHGVGFGNLLTLRVNMNSRNRYAVYLSIDADTEAPFGAHFERVLVLAQSAIGHAVGLPLSIGAGDARRSPLRPRRQASFRLQGSSNPTHWTKYAEITAELLRRLYRVWSTGLEEVAIRLRRGEDPEALAVLLTSRLNWVSPDLRQEGTVTSVLEHERAITEEQAREAETETLEALKSRLEAEGDAPPPTITAVITAFRRKGLLVAYARRRAEYRCEVEGCSVPLFVGDDGRPYLEIHHITSLANGGLDTIDNVVCVCAQHHRELHYGRERKRLAAGLRERNLQMGLTNTAKGRASR